MIRSVFFVSDSTGVTAEGLGNSLLSQFGDITFRKNTEPYIDELDKAAALVDRINQAAEEDGQSPIIIDTIVNDDIRKIIAASKGFTIDIFGSFLAPLEQELGTHSSYSVGKSRPHAESEAYSNRMQAVHYALDADDGAKLNQYESADIILFGVSRSGKTPTCLYLGLQYGIYAANYPITEEDLESNQLPRALRAHKDKLFGLTIDPGRLSAIRQERRANSRYSSLIQCEDEVRQAEMMLRKHGITSINTTHFSVEEIAARILSETHISRRT
ncbi:MAG: pyruvate, water dikinase regulatory protein [Pseudomonadales bacterium]